MGVSHFDYLLENSYIDRIVYIDLFIQNVTSYSWRTYGVKFG